MKSQTFLAMKVRLARGKIFIGMKTCSDGNPLFQQYGRKIPLGDGWDDFERDERTHVISRCKVHFREWIPRGEHYGYVLCHWSSGRKPLQRFAFRRYKITNETEQKLITFEKMFCLLSNSAVSFAQRRETEGAELRLSSRIALCLCCEQ